MTICDHGYCIDPTLWHSRYFMWTRDLFAPWFCSIASWVMQPMDNRCLVVVRCSSSSLIAVLGCGSIWKIANNNHFKEGHESASKLVAGRQQNNLGGHGFKQYLLWKDLPCSMWWAGC